MILDKNGIYYANYHPGLICEVKMGRVRLNTKKVTIALIDVVVMYPLDIFTLLKKTISYFKKELSENQQSYFNQLLILIILGVIYILLNFRY